VHDWREQDFPPHALHTELYRQQCTDRDRAVGHTHVFEQAGPDPPTGLLRVVPMRHRVFDDAVQPIPHRTHHNTDQSAVPRTFCDTTPRTHPSSSTPTARPAGESTAASSAARSESSATSKVCP